MSSAKREIEKELATTQETESDKNFKAFQDARAPKTRMYQDEMQFHQGVQVDGELLTSYNVKRNTSYTVWFDPAIAIVVFLNKHTGDIYWTPRENVKMGKFTRTA